METRPRTRLKLRGAAVLAALGALVVPATAGAKVHTPVITKVTPKSLSVGDTLVIHGKYFRRGRGKNRVLFRASGKSLFVKAGLSTTKRMTVRIPAKLETFMVKKGGTTRATRFRLRVLTTKLSKRFTATKNSPLVAPAPKTGTTGPGTGTPTCPTGADDDGDGLSSAFEQTVVHTNPCAADSDGDGVTDGYEYRSAVDLNNDDYSHPTQSLPYPGKRPYPNPLDPSDAGTDFDGDWLNLATEYSLWRYTVAHGASASLDNLSYSDGLKYSIYTRDANGRRVGALSAVGYDKQANWEQWLSNSAYATITWPDLPSTPVSLLDVDRSGSVDNDPERLAHAVPAKHFLYAETSYYDVHGKTGSSDPDGVLSDDERDEDADGLSNIDEVNYRMNPDWWKGYYSRETAFPIAFAGTSPVDEDSDGDGVRDGADDQDHDDVPNFDELSRNMVTGRGFDAKDTDEAHGNPAQPQGRVNPFNPCLPFTTARACPMYVPLSGGVWAPFDVGDDGDDPDYLVMN